MVKKSYRTSSGDLELPRSDPAHPGGLVGPLWGVHGLVRTSGPCRQIRRPGEAGRHPRVSLSNALTFVVKQETDFTL